MGHQYVNTTLFYTVTQTVRKILILAPSYDFHYEYTDSSCIYVLRLMG